MLKSLVHQIWWYPYLDRLSILRLCKSPFAPIPKEYRHTTHGTPGVKVLIVDSGSFHTLGVLQSPLPFVLNVLLFVTCLVPEGTWVWPPALMTFFSHWIKSKHLSWPTRLLVTLAPSPLQPPLSLWLYSSSKLSHFRSTLSNSVLSVDFLYSIFNLSLFLRLILTHRKGLNAYLIFSWKPSVMLLGGVFYFLCTSIILAGMLIYRWSSAMREAEAGGSLQVWSYLVYITGSSQAGP